MCVTAIAVIEKCVFECGIWDFKKRKLSRQCVKGFYFRGFLEKSFKLFLKGILLKTVLTWKLI